MEPDAASRKRSRCWLVVVFVLVLVSMVSWWYWPREDARFVGKWRSNFGPRVWQLKPNGHAILQSESSPRSGNLIFHTTWASEGDVLMIGRSRIGPARPYWLAWLIEQFNRHSRMHRIVDASHCVRVHVVESDRLEGVDGRWPDEPAPDPDVMMLNHNSWWDADDAEMKSGEGNYKLRRIPE